MSQNSEQAIIGIDAQEFRQTLGRWGSGVTIITATDGEAKRGMTANAFVSVSLQPPLILISVSNKTAMHELLKKEQTTHFGVNILSAEQQELSNHFAGQASDDLVIPWQEHQGVPILSGAVAQLVCRQHQCIEVGDHTLYIGLIEYNNYTDDTPLFYFKGKYQQLAEDWWFLGFSDGLFWPFLLTKW